MILKTYLFSIKVISCFLCLSLQRMKPLMCHPLDDLEGFHFNGNEAQLTHVHRFTHRNSLTGEHATLVYNITKCPKREYVSIPPEVSLDRVDSDHVILTFPEASNAKRFSKRLSKGRILLSHHESRCQRTGKEVLLEVLEVKMLDALRYQVSGHVKSPTELTKHAKIEFATNVVPEYVKSADDACQKEDKSFQKLEVGRMATRLGRGIVSGLRKNITCFEEFESLTHSAYRFYRSAETAELLCTSASRWGNISTQTVKTPGGWRIPFPSEILWENPVYPRMLCMDCYIRIQPVLRFSLLIENYAVKEFHISIDASTYLAIFPHVDIHESGVIQRFKLLERAFQPVYLSIGGLPYFITPHFKATLKLAHKLNTKAEIGFKTGFIGAMSFGISMKDSAPSVFGNMSFQQVPVDFTFSMGKSCAIFDGLASQHSLEECATKCAADTACNAFLYTKNSRSCLFTTECKEVENPSNSQCLFRHHPWKKPKPNPRVNGTAKLMITSHLVMLLNGIGGPMASVNQSLNWNFIRTNMFNVSRTTVDYKVNAAVGGRVQLRLGNNNVYEDELKFKPVVSHTEQLWSRDYL